jgi:cytochrome c-type biogenesis protein
MEAWTHQVLNSGQTGITILIAVFVLGMVGVLTCGCNYAVFAVVAGYSGSTASSGKTKNTIGSGVAFLVGAIIAMAIIGALFGYVGGVISQSLGSYWKIAAGLVCVSFGLFSMDLLPFKLPAFSMNKKAENKGLVSAIIFGLTVGGLSVALNSCCNPLFPIILAASFVKGSTLWGLLMLTIFALGYALPLAIAIVGLRLGFGRMSKTITRLGTLIKYVGGILLVLMGFYFLFTI